MSILYVTSDRDGAGKTALATALLSKLREEGKSVGYAKLFSRDPASDGDVAFARGLLGGGAAEGPAPQEMSALSGGGAAEGVTSAVATWASGLDGAVVEGPSAEVADENRSEVSAQLAEALDARVVVVLGYDARLTGERISSLVAPFGHRAAGVVVNGAPRYRRREARQALESAVSGSEIRLKGVVPEDRWMLTVTLGQVAEHLGGRWIMGEEKADCLVESFLIGGNIMDSGETYFGRSETKAVITRGDRPDIQLAALASASAGLVLTGGHEPVEYVYHEVEQQEVPLMVVPKGTKETSEALGSVLERSTAHHSDKVARFRALLEEHCGLGSAWALFE